MMKRMRWVGLWQSTDYERPEWRRDAEVFHSLQHARDVFESRSRSEHWWGTPPRKLEWLEDGSPHVSDETTPGDLDYYPGSPSMLLVELGWVDLYALETDGPYACSRILTVGPRGGVKITNL